MILTPEQRAIVLRMLEIVEKMKSTNQYIMYKIEKSEQIN